MVARGSRRMDETVRWLTALLMVAAVVGALGLSGCSRERPEETAEETGAGAEEAAPKPKLDPETLQPVISEVAPENVGPEKIDVEFAEPVIEEAQVGEGPGKGTELRITPEVDGELRFTSPSTLTFLPATGFAPATRYEVELLSLATRDGVLEPPAPGRWVHVFETPPFDFVRFALGEVDFANHKAQMQLIFSAAVDPREVAKRARIAVKAPESSSDTPKVRYVRGDAPHTVRAELTSSQIANGARVSLALDPGVPSIGGGQQTARPTNATVDLAMGPVARVLKTYRAEGTSGFYVQVICDDSAVATRRYYWDNVNYDSYEVSTRCQLDESDAEDGVHFEPPVDFSLAPAGGGFRIFGDFSRGSYQMRIDAGVRTVDGGMLHQAYQTDFTVPARSPRVQFVSKGRYLPRSSWKSLAVRHLNVSGATLAIRHVPAENLVFWMSDDTEAAGERTSNLIVKQQVPLRGETDVETTSYVDLGSLVPADTKGLLEVQLNAGSTHDTVRVLLTDLHLVAKRAGPLKPEDPKAADKEVWTWALDIDTVEPQNGVAMQLVRKSGYVLAECVTHADGGCRLAPAADNVDPTPPFAVVARRGDDLTYLKFDELKAEVQEARIAGEPYRSEQKYRAAVYSDRGVYRPGETAHIAAIVREETNLAPPPGMPVVARLVDPQGKTVQRTTLHTNAAGYLTQDVAFAAFAMTGRYEAQLHVADRQIGQYRFQVEEFVPERMKVEAAAEDPAYRLGEELKVDVAARYLFGGVPANHRVELSCELAPASFAPKSNANYHYGVWSPEDAPIRPLDLGTVTGELDAEGRGTFACPGHDAPGAGRRGPNFRGPAELVARAAVFEAGSGRTTVGRATVPVHPDRFYVGLQASANKVEAGSDVVIEGVTVDWQGNLVQDVPSVQLELIRFEPEWGWYFDEARGRETWRRYLRPVTEETRQVEVQGGKLRATWKPPQDGTSFLVRATAGNARTELPLEGKGEWYYWAPQESEVDQTPRPGRPAWLAVQTPASVKAGERFPVQVKAPYRGRLLLTIETDRLLRSEWMDVDAGDVVWMARVDDFVPNAYVTAFLAKDPHLDSPEAFLPDRAFGVQSVRLEPVEFSHQVALKTPTEVRSQSKLTVHLELGAVDGPTYATVAAVDEGILSLTRFDSPDPLKDIFIRRALGIETFETVGWSLLIPPAAPSGTAGGDEMAKLGRVQPVEPVALWSGLVEVPKSGKLDLTFDLPQYRGELRVMAVTAGPKKMGWADAHVTVRDPLVVQSTLPRFLTRGDELRIPVAVTNLSGKARDVEVALTSEALPVPGLALPGNGGPPIEIVGPARQTLSLKDGAAGTAVFRARALHPTGGAKLKVTATSGELTSTEEAQVPLLPAGPKSRIVQRLELAAGTTDVTPYLDGWVPLSERSTLWVTSNPYGESFDHLKYLVRYPYGCIEQTVSSTRPLLYLGSFIDSVDPELTAGGKLDDLVRRGVERLLSMQTPDGGFAYWPGGTQPAYWGTANATHLLLDAQQLGYPVPRDRIDDALDWMERQITNYYEAGRRDWYGEDAEPYFHFVLAEGGRARKARIEKLLGQVASSPRHQERESQFMLQAALYMAGDHRYEAALRQPDLTTVSDYRQNGWTFYSDRRMRGFMLATYVDLFGRDPAAEPLANLVAESLRGHRSEWYTTQELVWSITGLGKFVEAGSRDFAPPVLRAGGRQLAPVHTERQTSDRTWNVARASEYDRLTLEVPRKGEGKLYLVLSSEGVRENPDWRTGGEGLRLDRRYLDPAGAPLDLGNGVHALGDLVYVELTVTNTSPERIANVALVDRVPAGWEIENPRLGRDGSIDWIDADSLWQADHMDLRDDRLEVFGHLEPNRPVRVVYAVRAVTAGRFTIPAAEAEAMYDPRRWAREAGGKVEIAGPWKSSAGDAGAGME